MSALGALFTRRVLAIAVAGVAVISPACGNGSEPVSRAASRCKPDLPAGARPGTPIEVRGGIAVGAWLGRDAYRVDVCDGRGLRRTQEVGIVDAGEGLRVALLTGDGTRHRDGGFTFVSLTRALPTARVVRRWFAQGRLVARRLPDGRRVLSEARVLPYPEPGAQRAVDWMRTRP